MSTLFRGASTIEKFALWLRAIVHDSIELLPIAAFLFITSTPSQSLAFVEYVELSQQPLLFERDQSLAQTAIIGIDAFPKNRTAGELLNDRVSRIPSAPSQVVPGMAIRVMATAYSSTLDQTDGNPFITSSGTHVRRGTLAANFLPFGSKVRIGDFIYTVEDRLNARYNGRYIVDVWFPGRAEALQFGVRVVEMEIVSLPGQ